MALNGATLTHAAWKCISGLPEYVVHRRRRPKTLTVGSDERRPRLRGAEASFVKPGSADPVAGDLESQRRNTGLSPPRRFDGRSLVSCADLVPVTRRMWSVRSPWTGSVTGSSRASRVTRPAWWALVSPAAPAPGRDWRAGASLVGPDFSPLTRWAAAPGPRQHLCGGEPKVGLPVVSRPGFSERVHPLGRQEPRVLVCAHDDVPATVVHNAVVRAA